MRLDDEVSAFGHRRHDLALNRHGFRPAKVANSCLDVRVQIGKNFGEFCHAGEAITVPPRRLVLG